MPAVSLSSKMKKHTEINRSRVGQYFLQFYQEQCHQVLERGSLLDPAVPMTFVGSAGLTQIEADIEQGADRSGEDYVVLQPCFRHFDLEKVGYSPVHLSLFEMGGAFSFGRIQRIETLSKLWFFLTDALGFDGGQLWVTYFTGGKLDGIWFDADVETSDTWHRLGVPKSHIVGKDIGEGFWKQGGGLEGGGQMRKCGPTSEVFYDRGPIYACGMDCSPGCACGRFVEVANVLFIHSQIDQITGALHPLATPFDETVIGVERVTMAQHNQYSVFEQVSFQPLMELIRSRRHLGCCLSSEQASVSEKVIADHIRALVFLTADGASPPGKGGRERIMRLLIRGVITHRRILGIKDPGFLPLLIAETIRIYNKQYLSLGTANELLLEYFALESKRFDRTLAAGFRHLERIVHNGQDDHISPQQALELVKSNGIPFPLLRNTLKQQNIGLDERVYWDVYTRWRNAIVTK